jgi:hypothetical protein
MDGRFTQAHLGYNIVAVEKQLMGISLLITDMSGKHISLVYSSRPFNNVRLRSGSTDANHMSNGFLHKVDGKIVLNWSLWTSPTCMFLKECSLPTPNKLSDITGHAVAWLVEALCYKPGGSGFDS